MEIGSNNRSVGATLMNVDSSRSHSIFSIDLEMLDSSEGDGGGLRAGRLNLVDLAGSERQSKTGSTGKRRGCTRILLVMKLIVWSGTGNQLPKYPQKFFSKLP